jgi:hypothetical protein
MMSLRPRVLDAKLLTKLIGRVDNNLFPSLALLVSCNRAHAVLTFFAEDFCHKTRTVELQASPDLPIINKATIIRSQRWHLRLEITLYHCLAPSVLRYSLGHHPELGLDKAIRGSEIVHHFEKAVSSDWSSRLLPSILLFDLFVINAKHQRWVHPLADAWLRVAC